jgi:hypothetical protein
MAVDVPSTRPLIDKLGVKDNMRLSVLGLDAPGFIELIRTRTRDYCVGAPQEQSDIVFLGVTSRHELRSIEPAIRWMKKNGAMWIIYPKGIQTVTEANVREAGLAAGLVDNKVVSFSATQTGLRFVVPLAKR